MANSPLKNKWVVITRPKEQAATFAKNIEKVGGCLFYFPLIEITPINDDATHEKLLTLESYDIVIFVSVNAVEHSVSMIGTELFRKKILVTPGRKTADALADYGLAVKFCPERFFNSEALLSIEDFKKESVGKRIAIVRGSNGRNYLKNYLTHLGAEVDYFDVYKRHCPQKSLNALKTQWENGRLNIIVLTSASSTANFFSLAENHKWLNHVCILIGSPRMQQKIPNDFQGKIVVAEDPSDETLLNKLTFTYG